MKEGREGGMEGGRKDGTCDRRPAAVLPVDRLFQRLSFFPCLSSCRGRYEMWEGRTRCQGSEEDMDGRREEGVTEDTKKGRKIAWKTESGGEGRATKE
jgi:hypothetical protein